MYIASYICIVLLNLGHVTVTGLYVIVLHKDIYDTLS